MTDLVYRPNLLSRLGNAVKRVPSTILSAIILVLLIGNLALPMAAVISGSLFGALAFVAESLFSTTTVLDRERARHKTETAKLTKDLDAERTKVKDLAHQNRVREAQIISSNKQIKQLNEQNKLRATQIEANNKEKKMAVNADVKVKYRQKKIRLGDAVSDTSARISKRAVEMTGKNIGSMVGEAIHGWGTAVIVLATSAELYDTCEMMKDLNALDISINGAAAVQTTEVCGMTVPTSAELLDKVTNSPDVVFAFLEGTYAELPDFQWQVGWDALVKDTRSLFAEAP